MRMSRYLVILSVMGMALSLFLLAQSLDRVRVLALAVPFVVGAVVAFFQRISGAADTRRQAIVDGGRGAVLATIITNALFAYTLLQIVYGFDGDMSSPQLNVGNVLLSFAFYGVFTLIAFISGMIGGVPGALLAPRRAALSVGSPAT